MPIAVLAFLIGIAYWPGIMGAAQTPRWALIALMLVFIRPVVLTPELWAMLVLLAYATMTLSWSPLLHDGVDALYTLALAVGAFGLGSSLRTLRPVYIGLALAIGVSSMFAIAQWFGWQGIYQVNPPAGLFVNKNTLAGIAVLVLVAIVAERLWWAVPLALPAAVLPLARGPLLALIVALTLRLRHRRALLVGIAGVGALLAISTLSYKQHSIDARLIYWWDTLRALTPFGHGIGSFNNLYPTFASIDTLAVRPRNVHNDWLQLVFECGLPAVVAVAVPLARWWRGRHSPEGLVVLAFGVEMLFGFPLHLPATAFLGMLCLGHLCRGDAVAVGAGAMGGTGSAARLSHA